MQQLVTRVDDELCAAVDGLVGQGIVASRSEAVRLGLTRLVDDVRRKALGEAIVRGYQEQPQSEHEFGWADAATVRMIADEPW